MDRTTSARRARDPVQVIVIAALLARLIATSTLLAASDLSGHVLFNGIGVPGATVTATQGDHAVVVTTGDDGTFHLSNLDDGKWTVRVEMRGFVEISRDVTLPLAAPSAAWVLTMQSYEDIVGSGTGGARASGVATSTTAAPAGPAAASSPDAPDVVNGSVNNGAASPFAQSPGFGNNRPRPRALYTGGLSSVLGNSAWDATPFSFASGGPRPPAYGDAQLGGTFGGPLKIPWLISNGPNTVVEYQHNVTHNVTTASAEMPTAAERDGDFSQFGAAVRDPLTGLPFPDNVIPSNRISPQAAALAAYYPQPNVASSNGANYQTPVIGTTTQDRFQVGVTKAVNNHNTLDGTFAFQRSVTDTTTLFAFTDASRQSSVNATINWMRRFTLRSMVRFRYQLTRVSAGTTPFFANRTNISGDAGLAGNDQTPANWGPPTLSFPDVATLTDAQYQQTTNNTEAGGVEASLKRGPHNITAGGDIRWNRVNVASQPDPRGTLSFTGAATGDAFADFLLGVPTASAIAVGDTAIRLRDVSSDLYLTDDWRPRAGLTLNLGLRWEYEAPFTEESGRLANLNVAPYFTSANPILATNPVAAAGASYPTSLIRPDKRGVEPRLAVGWRPFLGSSLVIRGGYGIYRNLGIYQSLALLLAEQPPFSKTFSVDNSATTPLTLANPFPSSLPGASNTFAIDPNLRDGSVQSWQLSAQRDFPASLTVIAAYLGDKGNHLMQAFLPNTYPSGAGNPCPSCPSGFVYLTPGGTSLHNAAQFTLRRRLESGFTASIQYTLSKSTDDAATFGNMNITSGSLVIAQDWLDLGAERGPSSFDQRHLVSVQIQYTTGVGVRGGTLVDSFWGTLFKDWTVASQLTAGSGLPLTPVAFVAVPGTGIVGVRPDLTGVSLAPLSPGSYVNPAAFTTPASGTWGDAGRNSIRGPAQFSLNASVARVFRFGGRLNLEWRVDATNVLNRVTFATINTIITSPQFGLPTAANTMRRIQTTMRLRF